MDTASKLTLATLDELSDLGNIRMHLVDDAFLRERTGQKAGASVPAFYDEKSKTLYFNETQLEKGAKIGASLFLHEYGHHFLNDMIGCKPTYVTENT